jgi:hypothetical protein
LRADAVLVFSGNVRAEKPEACSTGAALGAGVDVAVFVDVAVRINNSVDPLGLCYLAEDL